MEGGEVVAVSEASSGLLRGVADALLPCDEPVPHARLGKEKPRPRRIAFELIPQLCHVDPQVVRLALVVGPSDLV